MKITIELTNVNLFNGDRLSREELERAVLNTVCDSLMEPFDSGAFLQSFTGSVKIEEDNRG